MIIRIGDRVRAKVDGFCVTRCCKIRKNLITKVTHTFDDGTIGIASVCNHCVPESLFTLRLKENPITEVEYLDAFKENFKDGV